MMFLKTLIRFIVERNCLYLISALFVLLGCLHLMHGPATDLSTAFGVTIMLVGIMQLYEMSLLFVGHAVYKRMGMNHDGLMLTIITLILVYDPTFFNNRIYTCADGWMMGVAFNVILASAAFFKLWTVSRKTRIPLTSRSFACLTTGALLIFLAPALVHASSPTQRPALLLAGSLIIPLIAVGMSRPRVGNQGSCPDRPWTDLHARFERYVFIIPLIILPLHVYELALIYDIAWQALLLPPTLLAIGIAFMKTTEDLGKSTMLHVGLALTAGLLALENSNGFAPLQYVMPFIAAYLVIAWSHTEDTNLLWGAGGVLTATAAGGCPESIVSGLLSLNPAPLSLIAFFLTIRALATPTTNNVFSAGSVGTLLLVRLSPISFAMGMYVMIQTTIVWFIACRLLIASSSLSTIEEFSVALLSLGTTWFYVETSLGTTTLLTIILHVHIVTSLVMWVTYGIRGPAPGGLMGVVRFYIYPNMSLGSASVRNLLAFVSRWTGHGLLLGAFLLLAVGFYVSINKERLLENLETREV